MQDGQQFTRENEDSDLKVRFKYIDLANTVHSQPKNRFFRRTQFKLLSQTQKILLRAN